MDFRENLALVNFQWMLRADLKVGPYELPIIIRMLRWMNS